MSDPPRERAEPVDTASRTLARIQSELKIVARSDGRVTANQALERIVGILAAAGYDVPGKTAARTEQFLRHWSRDDEAPD
jgi:hypothetical protein